MTDIYDQATTALNQYVNSLFDNNSGSGQTSSLSGGGTSEMGSLFESAYISGWDTGLSNEMKFFNRQLFNEFMPDINGYTLTFFIPPLFSFLDESQKTEIIRIKKFATFSTIDFTPPQRQVESESITGRSGGIPYATEVTPSNQCTATFLDNVNLDIFSFHLGWVSYIKELVEGNIDLTNSEGREKFLQYDGGNNETYGGIDYAASFFVVKYDPTMKVVKYVGKATGVFPQNLPNKELIGQRSANELTTLPFTYFCAYYEETMTSSHPIWNELLELLKGDYTG